ncbi:MAG: GNAT family N-acetyltransferase [Rickettsiaceae bacterium]|nr:GNAT family N-acetyltransferase [Rickettsiaceae bacterium]
MILEINNSPEDLLLLSAFLDNAGTSLKTFRYFASRPLSCIESHLITILLVDDSKVVAYGHLDKDNEIIWLGICVADTERGKSYGNVIMEYLVSFSEKNRLDITLKVDYNNPVALALYKKFRFEVSSMVEDKYYILKRIYQSGER